MSDNMKEMIAETLMRDVQRSYEWARAVVHVDEVHQYLQDEIAKLILQEAKPDSFVIIDNVGGIYLVEVREYADLVVVAESEEVAEPEEVAE